MILGQLSEYMERNFLSRKAVGLGIFYKFINYNYVLLKVLFKEKILRDYAYE